ncbi:MAG: hypothetical protein HKO62_00265 [Gammaproteobacteria bacterium]|nr:hypothetical protein [Gammaproteobacteria bacterium]
MPFPGARARRSRKARNKTLCKSGFHKWEADKHRQFDVKQGKLVTLERCTRCGLTRTTLR